ncbi:hypothetical protein MBLNU13_g10831t2 [Cladosporium sp. NU13]
MPFTGDLSDAAIAIREVLDDLEVQFGIFGGFAIATLGGPRESKDIDCAVHCTKEWLVEKLRKIEGFKPMDNQRPDIVTFLWGDRNVLLEFFPTSMLNMTTIRMEVTGRRSGKSTTQILDPVIIFKGKLYATSMRNKYSDAADLIWLETNFLPELRSRSRELSRHMIGRVIRRHPHLERTFGAIIGEEALEAATATAREQDVDQLSTIEQNQVQNGLLFGLPAAK